MQKYSRWPWVGVVSGVLLTLAPVPGIAAGLLTMFASLGDAKVHTEEEISRQVGAGMWIVGGSALLCPLGLALLIWSAVVLLRRRKVKPPEPV